MYGPKNKKSAFMALAAAGGLWAWQNRDKIRGWLDSQRSQMGTGRSFTGETRRFDGQSFSGTNTADYTGDTPAPRSYDPKI